MLELWKRIGKYATDIKLDNQLKNTISHTTTEIGNTIMNILISNSGSFF